MNDKAPKSSGASGLIGFDVPPAKAKDLTEMLRPQILSVEIKLRMVKSVAQKMFPSLIWAEEEKEAIITEVLRPAIGKEPVVMRHQGAGVGLCVDHYELDGVLL